MTKRSLRENWRLADSRYQLPLGRRQATKGDEQKKSRGIYTHNSYEKKGSPQQKRDQQRSLVFRTRQETSRVTGSLSDNNDSNLSSTSNEEEKSESDVASSG